MGKWGIEQLYSCPRFSPQQRIVMVGYREGSGEECAGYQEERYRLRSHGVEMRSMSFVGFKIRMVRVENEVADGG